MADTVSDKNESRAAPDKADISALLDRLAVSPDSNLIGVLQSVQDSFGYLPRPAIEEISRRASIRLSSVYGVITFYAQFYTEPRGRHTVRCCRGTACHVRGGKVVINSVRNALRVEDGDTTEDMMFTLETVACLGACALSPVMIVDDTYYGKMTARRVPEILRQFTEEDA